MSDAVQNKAVNNAQSPAAPQESASAAAVLDLPWREVLGSLPARIISTLEQAGVHTVRDVLAWEQGKTEPVRNFGRTSRQTLRTALESLRLNEMEGEAAHQRYERHISLEQQLAARDISLETAWTEALPKLSTRIRGALKNAGVTTLGQVLNWAKNESLNGKLANFGRQSRHELLSALERLASEGMPDMLSKLAGLLENPDALLERGLGTLTPNQRRATVAHFLEGRTLEDVGAEMDVTRERVRQIVTKGMESLREQWGSAFRRALAPVMEELTRTGGLVHADAFASYPHLTLPRARLMVSVAGVENVELRADEFLARETLPKFKTLQRLLHARMRTRAHSGVSTAELAGWITECASLHVSADVAAKLANKLLPLEQLPDGHFRLTNTPFHERLSEFLALAKRPLHVREIAPRFAAELRIEMTADEIEGDWTEAESLPRAFAALYRSPDILIWDKGTFAHRSLLTLSDSAWEHLVVWCTERAKNQTEQLSTVTLLAEMRQAGLETGNLNPYALRTLLGRTPGFKGLRKNWIAWADSFRQETLSLAHRYPEIAREWHPTHNGKHTPADVYATAMRKYWWLCPNDSTHEYQAFIGNRTLQGVGCPRCNRGWTVDNIRHFVASLTEHLDTFSPAELYLLFQQNGLLRVQGSAKAFAKALTTGRFPRAELEKFIRGEASLADGFLNGSVEALDKTHTANASGTEDSEPTVEELGEVRPEDIPGEVEFPLVHTKAVLSSLESKLLSSADEEAVQFLVASGLAKLWKHAFVDEAAALREAEEYTGGSIYATEVREHFLREYREARSLKIPDGYAFTVNGVSTPPNLMQRFVATRVRDKRRVGNWSGTGAGKTLSAILASRVVGARFTVICCPNAVVAGWENAIRQSFPDSLIATGGFTPNWKSLAGDETGMTGNAGRPRYLILNYEKLQQPASDKHVAALVEREEIDFVIIDEVHFAKQRNSEEMSLRKQRLARLLAQASARNTGLHVLGMSATPVINNLQEGRSLVELITGLEHDDLRIQPTVSNCMALHQRLVTLGTRWLPAYDLECIEEVVSVDCAPLLDELRALEQTKGPLALEQLLTRARLGVILQHVSRGTLIYTHLIDGIGETLRVALEKAHLRVGFYTGEDKSGLEQFLRGEVDVLIGTAAIGTGVDGLQAVCSRLIINVLPWTHAEYEQLKGRLYRQGQRDRKVTIVLPLTYADLPGGRWSWCESKMERLRFKKSIADAAVDGVVPEGHLRTPEQAYRDVMSWLQRLEQGETVEVARMQLMVPLPLGGPVDVARRASYGDFSQMNNRWNATHSATTHARLAENPEEWAQYHTLYRAARADWMVVPYQEMIRFLLERQGRVIGDFGCGEAELARALQGRHTVHSFDHVAANPGVVAADLAHVPLADGVLDVAVFSLSLMGANFTEYLREAHRALRVDGQLHIWEATSRFRDLQEFQRGIGRLGFEAVHAESRWKFTYIRASKSARAPDPDFQMSF
ncbi:zinc-ribbon domain-containing protein [Hyalangium gracile]|uniref:zinc-ribbon domain-containing protein n=1 Tax=Hyalangium gracile TaxID=394092 RepID=UPI001CCE8F63|nr:zinc-ribbon domain-containing protein [Hyalangium gracile]